ncbi:MAG: NAD(P)/FAD-dependent oxidoreductase [Clostridia bacterium]|nr:NAD(P)/FAD-dependent oxidoreductase [Clostridia bacterium]
MPKIAIVGAGAAGLLAAGTALEYGADVTMFDPNVKVGVKLMITGKGRCNVTNNSPIDNILANIPRNPRFLYAALNSFPPNEVMELFEKLGVPLKTERGARVFPVSDKAQDIVNALSKYTFGAKLVHERVTAINAENGVVCGVTSRDKSGVVRKHSFDSVILCTGGLSYPRTGSTGDGYRIAEALGHTSVPRLPSLVPLEADRRLCSELTGLSLRNVTLKIRNNIDQSIVFEEFGEMLFAHFGLTGPIVLSSSAHLRDMARGKYTAVIDLKPALDEKTLDNRLLSDFSKYINKNFSNALGDLLPQKMIPVFIKLSGIDPDRKVNTITRDERHLLIRLLKNFEVNISGFRPIDEAIITSGGINVKEISPKDMQSKLIQGLYFAGEVIDVDAYTGGFNLQIAFSTGHLAGMSAATRY